jgi:hypothetical protein
MYSWREKPLLGFWGIGSDGFVTTIGPIFVNVIDYPCKSLLASLDQSSSMMIWVAVACVVAVTILVALSAFFTLRSLRKRQTQ